LNKNFDKLKLFLDSNYFEYRKSYSTGDPVFSLHHLKSEQDIEIAGFIISCFSYGKVELIEKFTSYLFGKINHRIYEFTINFNRKDSKYFRNFYYRFNTKQDLVNLFLNLKKALIEFGSLKKLFLKNYNEKQLNTITALNYFANYLKKGIPLNSGYHYLIPDPEKNSTCKRLNLFLRWMIRKDEIDPGIWQKEINKSKLIIPVDTHVYRISRYLGLIDRKSCDLKFAIELTEELKKFDKEDPVKYDFALCHIGIENKFPLHKKTPSGFLKGVITI
jgi:uncharacterized protein (TIGR02757 family)